MSLTVIRPFSLKSRSTTAAFDLVPVQNLLAASSVVLTGTRDQVLWVITDEIGRSTSGFEPQVPIGQNADELAFLRAVLR